MSSVRLQEPPVVRGRKSERVFRTDIEVWTYKFFLESINDVLRLMSNLAGVFRFRDPVGGVNDNNDIYRFRERCFDDNSRHLICHLCTLLLTPKEKQQIGLRKL